MVPIRVATKQKGKIVVDHVPTQVPPRVPVLVGANGNRANIWAHAAPEMMVPDATGRPYPITHGGSPIRAVMA